MGSREPKATVVLPVFNAADTVERAIKSILSQTEEAIELLVVNDGSSDGSGEVIENACSNDSRARIVTHKANLGVVAAANHGHRLARSKLVARMDADDWSYPTRIARQVEFLQENPDCQVCGTLIRVTGGVDGVVGDGFKRFESWVNALVHHDEMWAERFIETPMVQPSVMIRRSAFESVGGYRDCRWAEDYDLWLRLFESGIQFGKVAEVLLDWTDRRGRLTRSDPRYSQGMFLEAKSHFVSMHPRARECGVAICGAGSNGKRLARRFREEGVCVKRFYDVHPRRIGVRIGGVEVFERGEMPCASENEPLLLSAVGVPGGREDVGAFATSRGYVHGESLYSLI